MAAAGRRVDVILVPEIHTEEGVELLMALVPVLHATLPKESERILNVSEGKGVPGATRPFFDSLYGGRPYTHLYEWSDESPDVGYMTCMKYVLTILTMINGMLEMAFQISKERPVKEFTGFPGITGHKPPLNYMELVYTQMYEGHKFVPMEDPLFREIDTAFRELYGGDASNFDTHVNAALTELMKLLGEKGCRDADRILGPLQAVVEGRDTAGRKEPVLRLREIIRGLFDERLIRVVESYLSEYPAITHVVMNIGGSHFANTVRLIGASSLLKMNEELLGLGEMWARKRRNRSRRNHRNHRNHRPQKRKSRTRRRSSN